MKNFNYQPLPLTAEEKANLQLQELSPDPRERLFTDYYTKTRHLLLEDYYQGGELKEDLENLEDERDTLYAVLQKLREDYISDLELWLEMILSKQPVYIPLKVKLILQQNEEAA